MSLPSAWGAGGHRHLGSLALEEMAEGLQGTLRWHALQAGSGNGSRLLGRAPADVLPEAPVDAHGLLAPGASVVGEGVEERIGCGVVGQVSGPEEPSSRREEDEKVEIDSVRQAIEYP